MELRKPVVGNHPLKRDETPDRAIVVRSATGVEDAYRTFRSGLLGFLRSNVHDPSLAEDLLHEVFVKATRALEGGEQPANLPAWLYRVARNTLIDHYRRQRPVEAVPDDVEAGEPFSLPPEQTLALCLTPFIHQLPETYREALLATAIEGRSVAAWAREAGLSQSAAKSRVSRGRAMLREKVLDCCHVEAARTGEVLEYYRRQ
ncbi:sigma-70 family RNA polymerase sigma factor [Marinobacter sp.]|uniref:sigma-70 family RNA polymerase sigma factor n=1 Tax=Marinobacter sp. TaxID=50741 RepID=UPI003567A64B